MKYQYQIIEDNGGGLYLFIFAEGSSKVIAGIMNLEYAPFGEWKNVKDNLNTDAYTEVKAWDGHMRDYNNDPVEFYSDLWDDRLSSVVAENGITYPGRMGAAAEKYFGIADAEDIAEEIIRQSQEAGLPVTDYAPIAEVQKWLDATDNIGNAEAISEEIYELLEN